MRQQIWTPDRKLVIPWVAPRAITRRVYVPGPCVIEPLLPGLPFYKTPGPGIIKQRLIPCIRSPLMAPFGGGAGGVVQSARRRAAGWTPADVIPEGWWRGDLGHAASDAATFSPWTNQGSESALDLAQVTSTARFVYDEINTAFNSQSSCHADGGDRMHSGNTAVWELADGEDASFVTVIVVDTAAQHTFAATDLNTGGGYLLKLRNGGASNNIIEDESANTITANGSSVSSATLYVHALMYTNNVSTTSDDMELRLDGAVDATATSSDLQIIRPTTGSGDQSYILGSNAEGSGSLVGDIAEHIFWQSLWSAGEDGDLELYLEGRYSLTLPGVTQ